MNSKSKALLLLAMSYGLAGNDYSIIESPAIVDKKHAKIKQNKAKGLKEFFYGENSVWALNQKSADRKAKNKGYILNT